VRKRLIIARPRSLQQPVGRLVAVAVSLATGVILLVGCSNNTPMPGENGPSSVTAPSATAPASTASSATGLPGLTDQCTQALNAQVAISTLFSAAVKVNGEALSAQQVSATFTPLTGKVPSALTGDIETLHQAATASVGKSAVDVAATLNSTKVTAAMNALNDYVKKCTPATS
jgi:hypothetical protein